MGSLRNLLPGPDGKPVQGLNIPNIPMGSSNVPKPPLYRSSLDYLCLSIFSNLYSSDLASNEEAWQEAREEKGINSSLTFPSDDVIWAMASTKDSASGICINDHGFATSIKVITGLKYWALAHVPEYRDGSNGAGDLGSIRRPFLHLNPVSYGPA